MRLDPDKVREILTVLANEPAPRIEDDRQVLGRPVDFMEGFGLELHEFSEYIRLLEEGGLLEAISQDILIDSGSFAGKVRSPLWLTWEGHRYLDSVESETLYQKTKEISKSTFGTITIETIKAAVPFAMQALLKAQGFIQ
jgi:hypothetical protein